MQKPSISRFLLMTTLLVSLSATLGVGLLWVVHDMRQHEREAAQLREMLLASKRSGLQKEVRQAQYYIEARRQTIETRLSDTIKDRAYEAHGLASHLYDTFAQTLPQEKVASIIREALRRIRFQHGGSYVFALDAQGMQQVNGLHPALEGEPLSAYEGRSGQAIADRMLELVAEQAEGFVSYNWEAPGQANTAQQKISYIKLFKPLGWIIGTGEYVKVVEEEVQQDILAKLETTSLGDDGYLFAGTYEGVSLMGPAKGNNMLHVTDANGLHIVQELIAISQGGDGFLEYVIPAFEGRPSHPKLSYVAGVTDWEWYIGAGVNLDDVDKSVATLETQMRGEVRQTIGIVSVLVCIMAGLLYCLFKLMAVRVHRDIASLVAFLQQDQTIGSRHPPIDMRFHETTEIATAAREVLISCMAGDAALQHSEERFKLAMEATSDGLWDWDVELGDVYYSPAYGAMLGFAPHEMQHTVEYWSDRIHPEDKPAVLKANMACIENRTKSFRVEFRMLGKKGEWVWILGRGKAVSRDENGRALRMVGTHTDITSRKKAEAALRDAKDALEVQVQERTRALAHKAAELEVANQELQKSASMKTNLMTTVSHELRTPLTSIYGFVKLIRKDFTTRFHEVCDEFPHLKTRCKRIDSNLDIIESEGQRLGRIINDFLDLSKIEAGRMAWNDTRVSPSELMRRAQRLVAPNYEAKEAVTLELKLPPSDPLLLIDEDRLVQVLVNLLDNACKHTEQGHVTLSAVPNKEMVRFTVADTGEGIPQDDLEQIFETFYQSPSAHVSGQVSKGTGLGLSICRQIVKHYAGRIWAESPPDGGAVFHVEIPVTESAPDVGNST